MSVFFSSLYLLEELACKLLKAPCHTGVGSARLLQALFFFCFLLHYPPRG